MTKRCTWWQCTRRPDALERRLWQCVHLKCLAFWCWMSVASSANLRSQ